MKLGMAREAGGLRPIVALDSNTGTGPALDIIRAWPLIRGNADGAPAPSTVRDLLARGDEVLDAVRELVGRLEAGDGDEEARSLEAIREVDREQLAPAIDPVKILCTGLNYHGHAEEVGKRAPGSPEVFLRLPRTLCGPFDAVKVTEISTHLDWEGELAVVIGRGGHAIRPGHAFEHVAGYAVFNDLTVRDWQHLGSQWTPGKNFDGTGPLGPFVVTSDEAGRQNRQIVTRVNGEVVQQAWTNDMVHSVEDLIAFCSTFTTLEPGDVIATGTPSGTGFKQNPPRFLRPSDIVEVQIDGLGSLENTVVQA